jgi:hypothetical protein
VRHLHVRHFDLYGAYGVGHDDVVLAAGEMRLELERNVVHVLSIPREDVLDDRGVR